MALMLLPSLVLFQKLTPLNVEATMMAFAASVVNLSQGVIGKLSAIAINHFVGVEKGNMQNYYVLKVVLYLVLKAY